MLDLDRLRADTAHCEQLIHLNNAGASLTPRVVLKTVSHHLHQEVLLGGYEAGDAAHAEVAAVYTSVARLLNGQPTEIAILDNATRAWDMLFYALPFKPGDVVLTSISEYAGNYIPYLQLKQRRGIEIEVLPNDAHGQVSLPALQARLARPGVALVSLPMIASNGGAVQPVHDIGALCRAADVVFLLDACQAAGQIPLDVKAIGCHMLTGTSRKYLRGPRGVGFLYIEQALCERLEPPFLDLHAASLVSADRFEIRADARRFESWEHNVAATLGFGAAVDYALDCGVDHLWARIQHLGAYLRQALAELPGVHCQDAGRPLTGLVTFTSDRHAPGEIRQRLAALATRINVTVAGAGSTWLDMQRRGLPEVVRASVHAYNTEAELDALVTALRDL
ncbi:aminotransferase class V [Pseudomonas sp. M47T1]|uniref:aminotransferase class V-fold PLP-dependent enzyme n=2 Tax=unclassified Pseudomonas TaxID=196821 RepID=UPI0002608ACA|nr:aminotransferase class V-fold PLP-dependent enzyme [Pseudomonas sp. M47T1]EIK95852.1 aminotransferase class V [Pseudomonas sp. M47T1]